MSFLKEIIWTSSHTKKLELINTAIEKNKKWLLKLYDIFGKWNLSPSESALLKVRILMKERTQRILQSKLPKYK